jgi:hypothetical protein
MLSTNKNYLITTEKNIDELAKKIKKDPYNFYHT